MLYVGLNADDALRCKIAIAYGCEPRDWENEDISNSQRMVESA